MSSCKPDGICSSASPSVASVGGREVFVGTPYAVKEVVEALARGSSLPGIGPEHERLAEAWAERTGL